jgi:membrane protease YdiL (CAAX protease family)
MKFSQKPVQNKIFAIVVFYIIAISLRYLTSNTTILENINSSFLKIVLQGIGPAIGALIALKIFGLKSTYSLAGRLRPFLLSAFIFIIIPVVGFAIIGINESKDLTITTNPFIASAKLSFYFIIYSILEEIGWRAFLQEQLTFVNKYVKILVIATLWFVWHLNFALTISNLVFFLILLFASWGIGKIGDITKSVLAVGAFHAFYNLISTDNFPTNEKYIVLFTSVIIWTLYIIFYDKINRMFMYIKK